jgi:hypothetical protein
MSVCVCGNSTLTVGEHTASMSTESTIDARATTPTKPKEDGLGEPVSGAVG